MFAPSESALIAVDNSLRETKFADIDYRDFPIGRQLYLKGTGMAVWEMMMIARNNDFNAEHIAEQYYYPVLRFRPRSSSMKPVLPNATFFSPPCHTDCPLFFARKCP